FGGCRATERVSERFVLPAERVSDPRATVTGTARGHPSTGGIFCAKIYPADEQVDHEHSKENHGCTDGVGVAGECTGVGEFYRALGDSDARFGAGVALKRTGADYHGGEKDG